MGISNLRERLLIQSCAYKYDQLGGFTNSWADRGAFWAEVQPLSYQSLSNNLGTSHYRVRWRAGLKLSRNSRFLWGEKILNILTPVQTDERKRWASVIVKHEGVSNE